MHTSRRSLASSLSRTALSWSAAAMLALSAARLPAQVTPIPAPSTRSTSTSSLVASLTVTVVSGATQSIPNLTDGAANNFSTPVSVTTAWDLQQSNLTIYLFAYFATPSQALGNGYTYIPSSRIKGQTNGTGAFAAFTQNGIGGAGIAGGSYLVFNYTSNNKQNSRTDLLNLQIDLTGTSVMPGTYSGTMFLRAVTQ